MAAKSTKGVKICVAGLDAAYTSVIPTAITKAKPAVVTLASTTGMVAGDVAKFASGATGFPELDGKAWILGTVTATTVALLGSDTTGSTGTLVGSPTMLHAEVADMTCLCLSEFTPNVDTPTTISTATFCDPNASIPSQVVQAGTVAIAGFVDITSADYQMLLKADDDGLERVIRVELPTNGYLIAPGIVSGLNWALPIDGAQGFNATITLTSKFRHLY